MTRSCPRSSGDRTAYLDLRRSRGETFLEAYRRVGMEPFKAALYPRRRAGCRLTLPALRPRPRRSAEGRASPTRRRSAPRSAGRRLRRDSRTRSRWSRPSGRSRSCCCTWSRRIDRDFPVLFIDTADAVPGDARLPARAVGEARPSQRAQPSRPTPPRSSREDPDGTLQRSSTPTPAATCARSEPLDRALRRWPMTGSPGASGSRRQTRAAIEFFEAQDDPAARSIRWPIGARSTCATT